jgi:uncharacterized protein
VTTIILKPTDGCNARCRYCSAAHVGAAKVMSTRTLRATFSLFGDWALRTGQKRLHFIWHGGEPLLMPPAFWEEVLQGEAELLSERGIAVENGIQTNATRITPEWIPLLRRLLGDRGVVGTSVEPMPGIRELKGAPDGAYATRWTEAIAVLRAAQIRYGIVYVVHRHVLPHLEATYQALREQHPQAGIRFNPLYRQGRAEESPVWDDLGITSEEWGAALARLHPIWRAEGAPPNILPFGPWSQLHGKGTWRLSCECSGKCSSSHFGVDPDGQVYLCGRSADGATFHFGEVGGLSAQTLQEHPLRRTLANRSVYLKRTACRDCPWWSYCHGGCVNDAVLAHGSAFAPTSFCAGLKAYFEQVFGPCLSPGGA